MPSNYGSLPFAEQIEFLRRKVNIPTDSWVDIYGAEHDYGFMVAGANRNAIVADFRTAVQKLIAEGATLEDFRKDFDNIVATHGWDYNGGRSWRSRTIYETNLFSSYNAGRFEQLEAAGDALPYRQYHHSGSENPRQEHLVWDGLVLRADDPWWQTHTPINAWGCQCSVSGLTEEDLADLGKSLPDTAPALELETRIIGQRSLNGPREVVVPKGIDPGFEHTPGRSRLEGAIPPERPVPPARGGGGGASGGPGLPNTRPSNPLPAPRALPANRLLPDNLSDEDYAQAFLEPFGATLEQPVVHIDVIGEAVVVGRELFVDPVTRAINVARSGPQLPLLAEALLDPDEIWVRMEFADNKTVLRRRYISRYLLPGQDAPALAVFESAADGWSGATQLVAEGDIDAWRIGIRLYRRP